MFALILSLYLVSSMQQRAAAAVSSVPGFTTQAACEDAARRWLDDRAGDAERFTKHAVCVRVSP